MKVLELFSPITVATLFLGHSGLEKRIWQQGKGLVC